MSRRILVNFRLDPDALHGLLPSPLHPKVVQGKALAGICLIRLEQVRPAFLPARFGVSSENAAHRIAVEWEQGGVQREGVFIPRRDTDSALNRWAGGRLFPGVHQRAQFRTRETDREFDVELHSCDRSTLVRVAAHRTEAWPSGSLFASLEEASDFFRVGCCGWSRAGDGQGLEGVQLCTDQWVMQPLEVDRVESSFFADRARFGPGKVEFDSALLMRGIPHVWQALGSLADPAQRRRRDYRSALLEWP